MRTAEKLKALKARGLLERPRKSLAIANAIKPFALMALSMYLAQLMPWLLLPMAAFIGTRYRQIANLVHWASHRSACVDERTNESVFRVLASFLGWEPEAYRRQHASHHRHLGDFEKDDDFGRLQDVAIDEPLGSAARLKIILSRKFISIYMPKLGFRDRWQAIGTIVAAVILVCMLWCGAYHALAAWLIGQFVVYPVIRYASDLVDHGGIYRAEVKTRNSYIRNTWLRDLLFPEHDYLHGLHHEFPGISAVNQEPAHDFLLNNDPEYAARSHAAIDHVKRMLG